jgi:hypothetical protein
MSITSVCAGDLSGSTFTLTADCETNRPFTIPPTVTTLDGAEHFIKAYDYAGTALFNDGVVTNATPGQLMTIQNLGILGEGFAPVPDCGRGTLFGIHFNDASGAVIHVVMNEITENSACPPSTGTGIRVDGVTAHRTVTIADTSVSNYQRNGIEARGSVTMNVYGGIVEPKGGLNNVIAQNGIVYAATAAGQPGGTVSGTAVIGNGDAIQDPRADEAAIVLAGARNVTISKVGLGDDSSQTGPDAGILVEDSNGDGTGTPSTGIVLSFNTIRRNLSDTPDPHGFGVWVLAGSQVALSCNTFNGWNTNIVGAIQINCTPLPSGANCATYSAHPPAVVGGTEPFTWNVTAGSLPPGLTLAPDGTITGTPTQAGSFTFTVQARDSSTPHALATTQGESISIASADCSRQLARTGSTPVAPLMVGTLTITVGAALVLTANRSRSTVT